MTGNAPGSATPVEPGGGQAVLLVIAGAMLAAALLPWGFLAVGFEIAAIVVGIRTLRRARRNGRQAPGALAAVIGGTAVTLILLVLLALYATFYEQVTDYRHCFDRAITESAKIECRETLETEIRRRSGLAG